MIKTITIRGLATVKGNRYSVLQSRIACNIVFYFMLSGRISRNIDENMFRSYIGTTSENTDFHVLVA